LDNGAAAAVESAAVDDVEPDVAVAKRIYVPVEELEQFYNSEIVLRPSIPSQIAAPLH